MTDLAVGAGSGYALITVGGRPLLVDLFCGPGGAAVGYHQAGFAILGVDAEPQPAYPFPMVVCDALAFMRMLLATGMARRVAAFHGSPPCQDYSKAMRHLANPGYPRLIEPTRRLLAVSGRPWVIENVPGAPLPHQDTLDGAHGAELCGTQFGRRYWRHRLFEASVPVAPPRGCDHSRPAMNPHNGVGRERMFAEFGRADPERVWRAEMGVDWVGFFPARETIPPVYTRHLGGYLMAAVVAGKEGSDAQ